MTDEAHSNGTNGTNGTAMTRSHSAEYTRSFTGMSPANAPSLGKVMRWLQGHDDRGHLRCSYLQLTYQTAEHAAEEKSPQLLDTWEVDPELADDARKARYREVGELMWNQAAEYMTGAKVPHVWRVMRRNADDKIVGNFQFRLEPNLETMAEIGADPPNERGAMGSTLRTLNMTSAILMDKVLQVSRLQMEMSMMDRTELRELREQNAQSVREREELLDRSAERAVRTQSAQLDLQMKGIMYENIGKAIAAVIAKHSPVPAHVQEFIGVLTQDELVAMASTLPLDKQQKMFSMLQVFAKAQEAERLAKENAEKKAKDQAEKDAKKNAKEPAK